MIVYYRKDTGEIVGSVGGRVHQPEEIKMWIGNPQEIDRIIIEWKPKTWKKEKDGRKVATSFEPDCDEETKPIVEKIEKEPIILHEKYRINPKTKKLQEKDREDLERQKKEIEEGKKRQAEMIENKKRSIGVVLDENEPIQKRLENLIKVLNIRDIK